MDLKTVQLFVDLGLPQEIVSVINEHLIDSYRNDHYNKIQMNYTSVVLCYIWDEERHSKDIIRRNIIMFEKKTNIIPVRRIKRHYRHVVYTSKLKFIIPEAEYYVIRYLGCLYKPYLYRRWERDLYNKNIYDVVIDLDRFFYGTIYE